MKINEWSNEETQAKASKLRLDVEERLDDAVDVILGRRRDGDTVFANLLELRKELAESDGFAAYRWETDALIECLPMADVRNLLRQAREATDYEARQESVDDASFWMRLYEELGAFAHGEAAFLADAINQVEQGR